MLVANAFVGSWALAADRVPALRVKALWWATAVAELCCVASVTMAAILINRHDWEFPPNHMLYEFSAIVAAAIMYSYALQLKAKRFLIYGFGGLFIMGLAIRALFLLG